MNFIDVVCQSRSVPSDARLSERQIALILSRLRAFGRAAGLTTDNAICRKAEVNAHAMDFKKQGPTLGVLLALCNAVRAGSLDRLIGLPPSPFFAVLDSLEESLGEDGTSVLWTVVDNEGVSS